jgi:chemotaxis methyl-accepting protein methylase
MTAVDQIVATLHEAHGLDIARYDPDFLVGVLEKRLAETAGADAAAYARRLQGDAAEAQALLQALQIGYSEFFRSPLVFGVLEQLVLPGLVGVRERTRRSELRIWSAGCAAGQEAWSVAMLLDDLGTATGRDIPYRIFGTDHAADALAAAREGVYPNTEVQNVRLRHLRTCLVDQGETYTIVPRLRQKVSFCLHDLLDENASSPPAAIFGDFDLILCCNLLFYYRAGLRQVILRRLRHSLAPQGYLVTGEAERSLLESDAGFRAVAPPAAVFRKILPPLYR